MVYDLSLLDKCPLDISRNAGRALRNVVATARAAEQAGFRRYWVAEHHHSKKFASNAPEVIVAYLLAATRHIRIGSGGVMLQHYSPYKIAEVFDVLAAIEPGRVDLGIGKTSAGLPHATAALQVEFSDATRLDFEEKLKNTVTAFRRSTSGGVPQLALAVVVDKSEKLAKEHANEILIYKIHFSDGKTFSLTTLEAAEDFGRLSGRSDYTIEQHRTQIIAGTAETVNKALNDLHQQFGIGEFMLELPATSVEQRIDAIGALAFEQGKIAA